MKRVIITAKQWEALVTELTGFPYSPHVDTRFELVPLEKTLPKWFLKYRPYVKDEDDCDDRSKYGYCEIHDKNKRTPITFARGRVIGEGYHEFMIVGGLDSDGKWVAVYCHRKDKSIDWINETDVTKVEDLW